MSLRFAAPGATLLAMLSVYLFSVLVGGVLLAMSIAGSDHGHSDADIGHHGHFGDNPVKFLSLRTLTYLLFVFGGVGSVLSWAWKNDSPILTFALSAVSGLGMAALVSASFAWLSRTDSGSRDSEESFVGLQGTVVLPIASGGLGKVLVQRGNRTYELLARPLDGDASGVSGWKSVVVVEMNRGTALVAPLDEPALTEST